MARLYISRMKSEVTNLSQRLHELENSQVDSNRKVTDYEKELSECRLLISQHEARMRSLQESMREAENKKRTLEESIDALREECAKLKAAEQVSGDWIKYENQKQSCNFCLFLVWYLPIYIYNRVG